MSDDLKGSLRERGVADEEIDAAEKAGTLRLLAVEHLVLPGPPRYGGDEVAAATGLPRERRVGCPHHGCSRSDSARRPGGRPGHCTG